MLVSINAKTGEVTELTRGNQAVEDFALSGDQGTVVLNVSTPTMIDELFVLVSDGSQKQITNINASLFAELNLTEPEDIWYTSFDGKKIEAWIQKPPDFDPAKKYPLILNIHGGPHSAYGWVFDHEFQWMAAKGYVVLYPNPRGSTSYGQDFGNIIQYKYPGDDYKDLMAGVDELLKRGYIDGNKLGVTGGSGGGLLTDWTVGHTHRFHAGGFAARHLRLDVMVVYRRFHSLPTQLVQSTAVRRSPGLRRAVADYVHQERGYSHDVHPGRRRLADTSRKRWRTDVSRIEVHAPANRDGALPGRISRVVAFGTAVAPRRTARPHRWVVRQVADGGAESRVQHAIGREHSASQASDWRGLNTSSILVPSTLADTTSKPRGHCRPSTVPREAFRASAATGGSGFHSARPWPE